MAGRIRSSLEVTLSVWHAIFLREALDRLFDMRAAWLWLLLEPVLWIAFHSIGYRAFHIHVVGGMDITAWMNAGFLGFLLWRRTSTQVLHAVDSNKAYFAYRQVKPFDTAFMRAVLEAFLMIPIAIFILTISAAVGYGVSPGMAGIHFFPRDPLLVIFSFVGLWLFGFGYGLITSVAMILVREMEHIFKIAYMPLYLFSGAIIPVASLPSLYRDIFLFNPVVHGVELMRLGFLPYYHTVSGISMAYLYGVALGTIFLGLVLYRRFSNKLVMR